MRTPLAWKNLTSSWSKCLLAASGVGFAVVLMFMQIGFRNALIDSNVQVISLFDTRLANVAVVSRARYSLSTEQRFARTLLDKIAALPEVQRVAIVNLERGTAQVQVMGHPSRPIRVVAVDLAAIDFFSDSSLRQKMLQAYASSACLVDQESKTLYGFETNDQQLRLQKMELNAKTLNAWGLFRLGTDFANDGTLLMSDQLHASFFPWRWPTRRPGDTVDIALLNVCSQPGESLELLCQQIRNIAPDQIAVQTTDRLVETEKAFWRQATPIGKIFFIGTLMGLIVGAIICYQIQFTDISDHMSEFATLKAMGYSNAFFWRFILQQSSYLACLGFVPGLIISVLLYRLLASFSGLIMVLTWDRIALVWLMTLAMCLVSGGLAIRKLFRSDPASLF
jgi:putative ABC transport system permease protein